ncbi:MAG: site-specific integrase [Aquabacterium sp.]|uniref:site-specific integrase n=1 Tax=Aquabacterium sp. TaxID=1872578 RepID=UPI00122AF8BD|nr:site-specific integrase [Aquabacterium sp.]TAK93741.1 MAG: site-specific integrase [Aquabacterium sp.]
MAKLPGLLKRGGVYHLRVMIPLDLRGAHEGRSKVIKTLKTTDRQEAALRGVHLRAQWLARFADLRKPADCTLSEQRIHTVALIPPATDITPPSKTMRHVFHQWKAVGDRSEDGNRACERALKAFEDNQGGLAVKAITYAHGANFRKALLGGKLSQKTARDYFVWVQALLRFAQNDLGIIDRNPWARLSIEKPKTTPRRPWTLDELRLLFGHPLFTEYRLPKDPKAGKAAAYWIPLLGMFTGARVSELAQLTQGDVFIEGGEPYLNITDEAEHQQLKTGNSRRTLPVHPELIRLGFMRYWQGLGGASQSPLWPYLPLRKGKPGGYFSQWFGDLRKEVGLGKYPDFHCFRHTVRTQLAEARYPEAVKDRVTGHSVRGSTGTKVYEHTDALIKEAVHSIRFDGLTLAIVSLPRCPT